MKRKFGFAILLVFIFALCFITSVKLFDYFQKQILKTALQKVSIGMSEKEVTEILGKPDHIWLSDTSSKYWCYETNTIAHNFEEQPDIECGNMLLEISYMSYGQRIERGRVLKIYDFK